MENSNENLENIETVNANEELNQSVEINKKEKKLRKKKAIRLVVNVLLWIFFLIVVIEAAIGIINMQKINNDKEPVWYLNKKVTKTSDKEETVYNLGLYKIVKTDTAKETKTSLKPFFIGD